MFLKIGTSFSSRGGRGGGGAADSKTEKNGFGDEAGLKRSEKEGVEMAEERVAAGAGCDPKKGFMRRVDEGGGGSWLRTGLKEEESLKFNCSRLTLSRAAALIVWWN